MSDSEKTRSSWWNRGCKWTLGWLERRVFLDILRRIECLAIIVAVFFYVWGYPGRKRQAENQQKAKHYQAWQVISAAQGKPGDLGRKIALQDLNRDGISLSGVDVSQAYLPQLDLQSANLWKANLSKANLFGAKLSNAVLQFANLSGADVSEANLSGALLTEANLSGANLSNTNLIEAGLFFAELSETKLRGANLSKANFHMANLSHSNLSHAYLSGADVSGVNFSGVDLSEANLRKSNLRGIKNWRDIKSIKQANIYNVKNPPDGFKEWAKKKVRLKLKMTKGGKSGHT